MNNYNPSLFVCTAPNSRRRKPRLRHRKLSGTLFAATAAAAATKVFGSCFVTTAFQTAFLAAPSFHPCQPSPPLHSTASIADVDVRRSHQPPYSRDTTVYVGLYEDEMNLASKELLPVSKEPHIKFKSLVKSPAKTKRNGDFKTTVKPPRSRSSTMPGFSAQSDRQRSYRDGIRLVEQRTGKKVRDTPEAKKRRRKENGDAMYRNSASVPDSLVQFADEIHQEDRISRTEEIELGEKTQEALRLQTLYDNLEMKLEREPTDEEWCAAAGKINMEAIRQAIEDGIEAKNKLVTSNLRMVQSVVNTYIRNGLNSRYNAGDMMQEGVIALIRAAEKFEPDRGWKFSTYAMYWVRASVKRSQIYQSRIISVPQRLYENHKRLLRIEQDLYGVLGRKPTRQELGKAVGMSELQVERCFAAMERKCVSLDQAITNTRKPNSGDRDKNTLIDLVDAKTDDGDYLQQRQKILREALLDTLNRHLKPDEVELLLLRYGLADGPSLKSGQQLTIAELSRLVGLKPDKVRRTINRSLEQLKAVGVDEWLSFEKEL